MSYIDATSISEIICNMIMSKSSELLHMTSHGGSIPLTYAVLKILYRTLQMSGSSLIMINNFTKSTGLDMIADKINVREDIHV